MSMSAAVLTCLERGPGQPRQAREGRGLSARFRSATSWKEFERNGASGPEPVARVLMTGLDSPALRRSRAVNAPGGVCPLLPRPAREVMTRGQHLEDLNGYA